MLKKEIPRNVIRAISTTWVSAWKAISRLFSIYLFFSRIILRIDRTIKAQRMKLSKLKASQVCIYLLSNDTPLNNLQAVSVSPTQFMAWRWISAQLCECVSIYGGTLMCIYSSNEKISSIYECICTNRDTAGQEAYKMSKTSIMNTDALDHMVRR